VGFAAIRAEHLRPMASALKKIGRGAAYSRKVGLGMPLPSTVIRP